MKRALERVLYTCAKVSCTHCKSHVFIEKSHVFIEKSPVFIEKSLVESSKMVSVARPSFCS